MRKVALLGAALLFAAAVIPAFAATTTVKISGNTAAGENQLGWMFGRDPLTTAPFEFNTDEASIGNGSLYAGPIGSTPANKFIAELFLVTPIGEVETISYDFKMGDGASAITNAHKHFYMNIYMNFEESDDLKFYDCRYDLVSATGSQANFTTVTFDPNGTEYAAVVKRASSPHNCPASPAEMGPNATLRMFSISIGDTSANDAGLDGYLDNIRVTIGGDTTIYDFDPDVQAKDDCKDGGWEAYGFTNQGQCIKFVNTGKDSR